MARGGWRPGSGRPKGSPNKRTRETIEKAAATGMLPHEFLCAVAQGQAIGGHVPTFEQRLDAAKAAAPFYAPKLASIEAKVGGELVQRVISDKPMTDEEWAATYGADAPG